VRSVLLLCIGLCTIAFANAEVLDSAARGFTVKTTLNIKAPPDDVYRKLVHDVGDWWNPAHTFSGDAHNLRIEDHPGGCLCEKLPNDAFVHHLEVIYAAPGKRIVLSGALGPLQNLAAGGSMQIQLTPVDGGTKLDLSYAVVGYLAKGMNTWAAPVDNVLAEQFTRLKSYVKRGTRQRQSRRSSIRVSNAGIRSKLASLVTSPVAPDRIAVAACSASGVSNL
jgi:uncharacterized protein YndB with AHSA1/START domain